MDVHLVVVYGEFRRTLPTAPPIIMLSLDVAAKVMTAMSAKKIQTIGRRNEYFNSEKKKVLNMVVAFGLDTGAWSERFFQSPFRLGLEIWTPLIHVVN